MIKHVYDEQRESKILQSIYKAISFGKQKLVIFSAGENKVPVTSEKIVCCLCSERKLDSAYIIVLNDRPVSHVELYFCSEECKNLWLIQNSERIEFKTDGRGSAVT